VRRPLVWIVVIVGGVVLLLVATALVGNRDDSDETVPAGQWAQSVCGAVGVWRGQLEAIVEDIRTPGAAGATGTEEPQSETPQGRTGFVRSGLERAIQATETMVEGIDNAGVPDTENGEEAAEDVSIWAERALDDLEEAQDSLDEEAETIEESIEQFGDATGAIGATIVGGVQTIARVAVVDPALGLALRESSTCEQVREEAGR
jgi:hypothetical protein